MGEYLPRIKLRTPIIPAALKNEAGIIGAALQASSIIGDTACDASGRLLPAAKKY